MIHIDEQTIVTQSVFKYFIIIKTFIKNRSLLQGEYSPAARTNAAGEQQEL